MNDDLISREALKEQAETVTLWNGDVRRFVSYETIDNAPTVNIKPFASVTFDKDELEQIVRDRVIEPIKNGELVLKTEERPQGEWIVGEYMDCHSDILPKYTCPFCGEVVYRKYDFCHCGADMSKEANNETN